MSNKKTLATYGLVACGGSSSRMGTDKSMLTYHQKPQRYHVYEMLQPFCEKVFISCREEQAATVEDGYNILADHPAYNETGPMAALLSAFAEFPQKNMLLIGCDYPFLTANDLQQFSAYCNDEDHAVAFYNDKGNVYEPLLAWYNHNSFYALKKMYDTKQYSLQHFLRSSQTVKFYPTDNKNIESIDTREAIARYRVRDTG